MSSVVEFASYKLKEGVSASDFLLASDKFNSEFLSAQKGYISRKLLVNGEWWADIVLWETMDDVNNAISIAPQDFFANKFLSLMDWKEGSIARNFYIEKSY